MPIIDLHCDTVLLLMADKNTLQLRQNDFCVDVEKLKQASSMAQFFALFVDLQKTDNALETCLEMADTFYAQLEKNQDALRWAGNYRDLLENKRQNKISAFLTIEEGGVLRGQLHHLRNFYHLGVRLITLTWNYPNEIGYPNKEAQYRSRGLTPFGKEVVREMNRLGMLIDVSHLSDQGFYDVAALSTQPFVASHSNARTVQDHPRNLTDDMIRVLAEKGGVMGINFERTFLGNSEISRVEDMVRHIKHIRQVGGIDVIALGTDFDGIEPVCEVSHIGEIGKLEQGLRSAGFAESDIEKICHNNAERVIRNVLR
ncbi:metal-dependent hydrolase [Lucifera butyrica]|uniref:Metal-dependent hydrolase n=1 Tax=Lucifera butyrica TaxID=1351585 RepID=A0A498R6T8_9FIRM|nr:dipeptidase [Lucifera butyrica]VBB06630.1 metal-dependent hydrolase [Lucifera butyrica]